MHFRSLLPASVAALSALTSASPDVDVAKEAKRGLLGGSNYMPNYGNYGYSNGYDGYNGGGYNGGNGRTPIEVRLTIADVENEQDFSAVSRLGSCAEEAGDTGTEEETTTTTSRSTTSRSTINRYGGPVSRLVPHSSRLSEPYVEDEADTAVDRSTSRTTTIL